MDFRIFLKEHSIKYTPNREAILNIFYLATKPLSYDDVFLLCNNQHIDLNLSTVYRIIDVFHSKRILTQISSSINNKSYFEFTKEVHSHYFYCISCKKMYPIINCPLDSINDNLKNQNFRIYSHKLEVSGVCNQCN